MKRDRKTITALKKKIRQLEKLLESYENEEEKDDKSIELEERRQKKKEEKVLKAKGKTPAEVPKKHSCPKCASEMEEVDLGPFKFKWCIDKRDCNYREKIK